MSGYIFQVVWPITDETFTQPELIEQAAEEVHQLAGEYHATITGPGTWQVDDGHNVTGWESYEGLVLIGRFPAEPDPTWQRWRGGSDTDSVRIRMAVDGRLDWEALNQTEKITVLRLLWDTKTAEQIAKHLRTKLSTIRQARARDLKRSREVAAELAS